MIHVNNLTKSYGKLEVLKGISFTISRGIAYGFLGQNGAGKTTTMNILTGLIDFNGGEIIFDDVDFKKNKRQLLSRVGFLPQNPVFYGYMNAYEYLSFIGNISGMDKKKLKDSSEKLLKIVKLEESANRKISGYSGGMKQRLGIAAALLNDPEILFLDEPTSALDPEGRMEVLELINTLKQRDVTVFLSTHILNDVERVCDEVSIIDKGKILVSEKLEDLKLHYLEPIFDIEFENDCKSEIGTFEALFCTQKVVTNKNKMNIYVKDIHKARTELLSILLTLKNPIISFGLRKSNLEDIFLRMVRNNENL